MFISSLVEKIFLLNNVQDEFWKSYLERIRNGIKVTWYHSSGFDMRALIAIRELTSFGSDYNSKNQTFNKIGKELQNTDIIFSDYGNHYYDALLNICNKKQQGVLGKEDFYELFKFSKYSGLCSENLVSIFPFCLFTDQERKALKSKIKFRNGYDIRTYESKGVKDNRKYDGFALKISNFTSSYITIIFLCLDDRIVKQIFEDYQIEVVCIFENATGAGLGGGFLFEWLYDKPDKTKEIKYFFTDNFSYEEENNRLVLNDICLREQFIVKNYLFGKRKTTLKIKDSMEGESGIGEIIIDISKFTKNYIAPHSFELSYCDNSKEFQFTETDYLLKNFLFGIIHGKLRIESYDSNIKHGKGFCLAIRK